MIIWLDRNNKRVDAVKSDGYIHLRADQLYLKKSVTGELKTLIKDE